MSTWELRPAPFHEGHRNGADRPVLDAVEHIRAGQRIRPALPLEAQLVIVDGARAVGGEDQLQIDRLRMAGAVRRLRTTRLFRTRRIEGSIAGRNAGAM